MSGLLIADVLVLNKQGEGAVAAVGNFVAPGASTTPTAAATGAEVAAGQGPGQV
jgi:hypothetical protein